MIDIELVMNRLDQMQVEIDLQKAEIQEVKRENMELKEKLSLDELPANKEYSIPRSCYELKAIDPNAQTGIHYIDPDGQINAEEPMQVFCDMTTSNNYTNHFFCRCKWI